METMNARERFVRTLTGQPVDRVPFMKVFGGVNKVLPRWERECPGIGKTIDQVLQFEGRGRGWASTPVKLALCDVSNPKVVEDNLSRTVYRYPDGTVQILFKEGEEFVRHTAEYPIKSRQDWLRIKGDFLNADDPRRFPPDWKDLVAGYRTRDYPLQLTHAGVYGFAKELARLVKDEVDRGNLETDVSQPQHEAVLLGHAVEAPAVVGRRAVQIADFLHPLTAPRCGIEKGNDPERTRRGMP